MQRYYNTVKENIYFVYLTLQHSRRFGTRNLSASSATARNEIQRRQSFRLIVLFRLRSLVFGCPVLVFRYHAKGFTAVVKLEKDFQTIT